MYGKGGKRVFEAQLRGAKVDPYSKRKQKMLKTDTLDELDTAMTIILTTNLDN